jgi:hypothetical protein
LAVDANRRIFFCLCRKNATGGIRVVVQAGKGKVKAPPALAAVGNADFFR